MTIDRWITTAATTHPDKCAIEFEGTQLSYGQFAARIDALCTELKTRGIGHGDRVVWYGLNNPMTFVLLFACARIGALLVPLNWRLADAEIAQTVANCQPAAIYWDETFAQKTSALPLATPQGDQTRAADINDPLLIVYTSGSTGIPKGVVLSQKALVANAEMSIEAHGLDPADVVLNVLPLFHVGGLNILPTPAFSIGATVILHKMFDPSAMLVDLQRVQAAITVPTVLDAVLNSPDWPLADLSNLRCLSIGSTDVPRSMFDDVHARNVPLMQIYGATETAPFAIYQTHENAVETTGSIGRLGRCDVRLVTHDGQDAATGQPGEIWVRGENTLLKYWNNPEQTAQSLEDGWFKTGDVAKLDEAGNYYFVDRIKHIIISGGENIYPAEIERVLNLHPSIKELCVIGLADAKWGQTPVVVAVPKAPVTPKDLLAGLNDKIARYKQPRRVIFVDALPRNAMGKVVVDQVKAMIMDHHDITAQ